MHLFSYLSFTGSCWLAAMIHLNRAKRYFEDCATLQNVLQTKIQMNEPLEQIWSAKTDNCAVWMNWDSNQLLHLKFLIRTPSVKTIFCCEISLHVVRVQKLPIRKLLCMSMDFFLVNNSNIWNVFIEKKKKWKKCSSLMLILKKIQNQQ